ncbi:MAG: trigger factor [Spirochaetales bacterium]|nr:trigger factor [Spirochaetales bacterium]
MVADKKLTELENSQMALTITVDAETLEKAYSEKLNKYTKEIQLPGFRKGKAPSSMIEKKFGDAIREEISFDTMETELKGVIETLENDQKPLPYCTPVLQDEEKLVPFKKNEPVTFTVHYDVRPKFELAQYTGLEVEFKDAKVTESDIDAEVKKYQEQNAMVIAKDGAVEKGDIVTCDYAEIGEDGSEVASTSRKDFTFTVGSSYNFYEFDDEIVGMKKGEEKKFEKSYAADYSNHDYAGKTITLDVKVTEVKKRELPEVDDEFAQDVKEEYKTVADMRNGISERLSKELEESIRNEKLNALLEKISAATTIAIPASMIDFETENTWNNYVRQTGLSEEQLMKYFQMSGQSKEEIVAQWREPATKNLKNQLIMEKIQKTENFPVDEEEVKKQLAENTKEDTDEATRKYLEEAIRDDIQYKQVVPFLLEKNVFKASSTVSYAEYVSSAAAN